MIIVKFPKVSSTQFELVTNCHRLTLKLVKGLKKVYFFVFLQSFPCLVISLVVFYLFIEVRNSFALLKHIYGFWVPNLFDSNHSYLTSNHTEAISAILSLSGFLGGAVLSWAKQIRNREHICRLVQLHPSLILQI